MPDPKPDARAQLAAEYANINSNRYTYLLVRDAYLAGYASGLDAAAEICREWMSGRRGPFEIACEIEAAIRAAKEA